MKLNFLVVGDIHLEGQLKEYLRDEDYLSPVSQTLKQIWQYAKDNGIKHIMILGDIFDNPFPKDETKKAFLKSLDKSLEYHIILGNHDYANINENSLNLCKYFIEDLGLMDNVRFYLKPVTEVINGIKFDFLPYPYKEPLSQDYSICLGHFESKGSISDSGRPFKDAKELEKGHTWFLGHLHRQQGDVYPGSILQHRFGEPVNKYFFDVTIEDDNNVKIEKISINTPYKLLDLIVNKIEDLQLSKENIYRLYLAEHLDLTEVNNFIKGYHIWQIKGISKNTVIEENLTEEDLDFQSQNLADELVFLEKWLKEETSLTEEEIVKTLKVVEEIKNRKLAKIL